MPEPEVWDVLDENGDRSGHAHLDMFVARVAAPGVLTIDPREVDAFEWVPVEQVVAWTTEGRLAPPWVARLERLWPAVLRCLSLASVESPPPTMGR